MSEIFITTISTKQIENRHNVKYPTYVKKKKEKNIFPLIFWFILKVPQKSANTK